MIIMILVISSVLNFFLKVLALCIFKLGEHFQFSHIQKL